VRLGRVEVRDRGGPEQPARHTDDGRGEPVCDVVSQRARGDRGEVRVAAARLAPVDLLQGEHVYAKRGHGCVQPRRVHPTI
jgi:hypothetical protein